MQAQWDGWKRRDGTNTTWKDKYIQGPGGEKTVKDWDRKQAERRRRLAKESQDIELTAAIDIHNNDTRYRAQAYDEKKAEGIRPEFDFSANYWKEKAKEAWYLRDNSDDECDEEEGEVGPELTDLDGHLRPVHAG